MIKYLAAVAFFLALWQNVHAQTTGFRGKRGIVKTTVVSGIQAPVANLDLEFVTSRMTSVTLGLTAREFNPKQKVKLENNINISTTPTKSAWATLELRLYPNRIMPAPQGFYLSLGFGMGLEKHSFKYHNPVTDSETWARKASAFGFLSTPSFGYQGMLGKRFTWDLRYANETFIVYDDAQFNYAFLGSNLASLRIGPIITGPSLYLKAGFLLF